MCHVLCAVCSVTSFTWIDLMKLEANFPPKVKIVRYSDNYLNQTLEQGYYMDTDG